MNTETEVKLESAAIRIELDISKLKVRHVRDLERSNKVDSLLEWLRVHANIDKATEESVLDMELNVFAQFFADLLTQINQGIRLPKAKNGSSSPS